MNRKIRILFLFMICFFIGISFPTTIKADLGPKPSINIEFIGVENEVYYVTLLSEVEWNGPYDVLEWDEDIEQEYQEVKQLGKEEPEEYAEELEYYKALKAYSKYQDEDGFYVPSYIENCTEDDKYVWGYWPPDVFKVLVYFPKTETFFVTPIYEAYAFDSYYTVDLSQRDKKIIYANPVYQYTKEIIGLAIRMVITILIELAVAFFWKYRDKKTILFILWVNIATQLLLNILLNTLNVTGDAFWGICFYLFLEAMIVEIEFLLYKWKFSQYNKDISKKHILSYAIVANILSFATGFFLAILTPLIL